jgi:tetraacyldisaccharide 4'-kinase
VVVGSSRFANGLRACGEFGVDACVLDDGFQHRRLFRDLDLVLLDATNPFGNGRLLPSGSLREPATALRRAHAVILTNAGWAEPDSLSAVRATLPPGIVFARARHRPMAVRENSTSEPLALDTLQQGTWLPLSSLGRPESFERTLRDLGVSIAAPARFPDHHPYRSEDLARVMGRVRAERLAGVVTTEKDAVKIPADWLKEVPCRVLEVDLELVEGRGALEGLIHDRIVAAGAGTRPLEANKTDR